MPTLSIFISDDVGGHGPAIARMLAASPHRGAPDGYATLNGVGAGASGDGSVCCQDGLLAVVEGRIDNARDLARSLGLAKAPSPSALVVDLWRRHGVRTPEFLRGRCAVGVSDGATTWVWRDHLGFAPIFYGVRGRVVAVATEAKQVAAGLGLDIEPDVLVVQSILSGDYDDETPAALRGVSRLPKATLLTIRGASTTISRYWYPERMLEQSRGRRDLLRPEAIQEQFDALMSRACERALGGADVLSLSGGVDSPAVAAYTAPVHLATTGRPLEAVVVVYPDHPTVDESGLARLVAAELGLKLGTYQHPRASTLGTVDHRVQALREWVRLFDGPGPLPGVGELHENYSHLRERGFRTVLTGELAEFVVDMRFNVLPHLLATGQIRSAVRFAMAQRDAGVGWRRTARQAISAAVPRPVAQLRARRQIGEALSQQPPWLISDRVLPSAGRAASRNRWRTLQLSGFVGPGLSMEADDVVQAKNGVTSRRPFADVDLWEMFLSLPAGVKAPGPTRKALLRSLLRGRVPDAILDRKDKTVFNAAVMDSVDWPVLAGVLTHAEHRFEGIDYPLLQQHVARRDADVYGITLVKRLVMAHLFVEGI